MKVTEITVRVAATRSLPGYSNISESVEMRATVSEDESPIVVTETLHTRCQNYVHAVIDLELEREGLPAHFDQDQHRYRLVRLGTARTYFIIPDHITLHDLRENLTGKFEEAFDPIGNDCFYDQRYPNLIRLAYKHNLPLAPDAPYPTQLASMSSENALEELREWALNKLGHEGLASNDEKDESKKDSNDCDVLF